MSAIKRKFVIEVYQKSTHQKIGWVYNIRKLRIGVGFDITGQIEKAQTWKYKKSATKNILNIENSANIYNGIKNYNYNVKEITPLRDIRNLKLINLK